MLYQIGPITFDDGALDLQDVSERVAADFAKHSLIGTRKDYEFSGPGDDPIELHGHMLPFHLGGLSEYEAARSICTSGQPVFVVRGDGTVRGWHQIMEVTGRHRFIAPNGIGFEVEHGLRLERCRDPGGEAGGDLLGALISLFG